MSFLANCFERLKTLIHHSDSQRRLILVIVSTALLLDNMLYMVIVPIIPDYLTRVNSEFHINWLDNQTHGGHKVFKNNQWNTLQNYNKTQIGRVEQSYDSDKFNVRLVTINASDAKVGTLFAFKAIVQLFVNPISGTVIDRIGYDMPMMIGLSIIFLSTSIFAFGSSYKTLFIARGLQGAGSAFADTAGFAMIADRYTEENERSKALGIALAFVSFGCLVAPPFGGILYDLCGKEVPFIVLAFVALLDGFLMFFVMQPVRIDRMVKKAEGHLPEATPIWKLFMDPYVLICAGTLAVCNISLAFLEPTIANWMEKTMHATNVQVGLIWFPAFIPHVLGVVITVKLAVKYPSYQWLMAGGGLVIIAVSCLMIPFCNNYISLMIPISILCFGVALVDTAILPTMAYIVDTRHVSVYGSVYAIADISYSLAYAIGPIVAGGLVTFIGFTALNMVIFAVTIAYAPVLFLLRNMYQGPLQKDSEKIPLDVGQIAHAPNGELQTYTSTIQSSVQYSGYDQDGQDYSRIAPQQNPPTYNPYNAEPPYGAGYGY
ncbi:hypothetical protein Ciccas_009614 [Cichlidogyrus casuarinus]|uniref:Major facilitator superfamily (MFS) profile domain-containing protein n=1 Tax=Cichlidogyrus casuarinus TaxID=1844966 RepID=A0ABD2PX73_9PLAT